jgi:catechol 2,3-dioxygenase
MRLLSEEGGTVRLGAGTRALLNLHERRDATRATGTTGLYHFAVLVPSRLDLARSLRRLVETNTPLDGASDHGVSEALYLSDPDGNGIEIYRDRPRAEWPRVNGRLNMTVDPLDVEGLLAESAPADDGLDPDTVIGHVHLHVSSLPEAEAFYAGVLGFDVTERYGRGALFVSAGGYHHHLGLNTWAGVGLPPAPEGSLGLRRFEIRFPDAASRATVVERVRAASIPAAQSEDGVIVRDPSGNALLLSA